MKNIILILFLFIPHILFANESDRNPRCPYPFVNSSYCAKLEWINGPSTEIESIARITFWKWNATQIVTPSDPESFNLQFSMPHHDHGTSPVVFEKQSEGIYLVKEIYLTMPGLWMLSFFVDGEEERDFIKI